MKRLALSVLFLSGVSFGQGFMPENDLYKQDELFNKRSNIQEDEFTSSIKQVEDFYIPLIKKAHQANLVFVNDWSDPTVNAYATQDGSTWEVHIFGGLARRPEITVDAFQLVACHELGHHLGGFPYVQVWAANEGQADYFSTLSCVRELWKHEIDKNAQAAKTVPSYPKKLCDKTWHIQAERNLCYRLAQAGKSLAALLSAGTAKYETPDKSTVDTTDNDHPQGQCRLDTYMAGALCTAKWDKEVIPKTESESAKYTCSNRPRCWFKPGEKADEQDFF